MPDDKQLSDVLTEFARTMVTDFSIEAILDRLVDRIVDVLPVTAAGVTLIAPGADPRYIAASDESALRYEKLQTELAEGPCLLAYHSGEAVSVPDLRGEGRFPAFTPRALRAGLVAVFTFPLYHGDRRLGALDLYRASAGPLTGESMSVAQTLADVVAAYVLNAQAREDLQDASDRSRQASLHDALTGLPNRVLFLERVMHAFQRSRRSGKASTVFYIDLDLFKVVNDTHGHRVGDELLVAVAGRLTNLLRPSDTLARLSGDEFVMLCEDLDSGAQADAIGARMATALHRPFALIDVEVAITASIGISFAAGHGVHDAERLLHRADMAMYQAKHKGGSRQQFFGPPEQDLAARQEGLSHDLRQSIEKGQLSLQYQPIVTIAGGQVDGFKAQLRWTHPERGVIPDAILLPLAERSQFISHIGEWVLQQALADRNDWQRGRPDDAVGITVNISGYQLMAPGFAAAVKSILASAGGHPDLLTLEITEGVFIQDSARALMVLDDLKGIGVMLALDEFGTGYSSLNYLKEFPIDILKVDRTLIANLGHDPASSIIVDAVVRLAHHFEMTVVAEGVDTAQHHQQVTALGCDLGQGSYFAGPMPAADVRELLSLQRGGRSPRPPARLDATAAGTTSR